MSNADEIEKLHRLKESGAIDEAEFQQAKARLLRGERSEPPALSPTSADSLHGIGGWLLFLCIVLTVITPLLSVGFISSLLETARTHNTGTPDAYIALIGLVALYSFYVGVNLWNIKPRAVEEAKRFFVIAAFTPLGATVALEMDKLTPNFQAALLAKAWQGTIPGIASSIIWYQYLKKSRRVSNTYPQP